MVFQRSLFVRVLLSSLLASIVILLPAWLWARSTLNQTILELEVADKKRLFKQWCHDLDQQSRRTEVSARRLAFRLSQELKLNPSLTRAQAARLWNDAGDGSLRSPPTSHPMQAQVIVTRQTPRTKRALGDLRAAQDVLMDFGPGSLSGIAENSWYLPQTGGEALFWPNQPDFVREVAPNLSYEGTDWVDLALPQNNPEGEIRWTRLLWDPGAGVWMISVTAPVAVEGEYRGVAGHDIGLEEFLSGFRDWFSTDSVQLMLFDPQGDALLVEHPGMPSEAASMVLNYAGVRDFDVRDVLKPLMQGNQNDHLVQYDAHHYLLARRLQSTGWFAVIRFRPPPKGVYLEKASRQLMGGLGVFVFVLSGLILFTVMRDHYIQQREKQSVAEAYERAEKASRSKTLFLANLSHEIRSPLGALIGAISLLRRPMQPAERNRTLGLMEYSCEALRSVIDDVLEVARIEHSDIQLENNGFYLQQLVRMTLAMFQERAADKGIELVSNADDLDPELQLDGDEGRIRQVLINLLTNAIKFTREGRVELRADYSDEEGLQIEVLDSGIGIDPDRLEAIFEPFIQSSRQIRKEFGGTGLGLSISRELARAMGGQLQANNLQGGGACFRLTLPLEHWHGRPSGTAASSAISGMPQSLLLVAPDDPSRQVLAWQLEEEEYSVNVANSLHDLTSIHGFQCLIHQYVSYDEELNSRLWQLKRARPELFLVVLMSHRSVELETELQQLGVDGFVLMPARLPDLVRELARISTMRMRDKV